MARKQYGHEAWLRACKLAAVPDDLPVVKTRGIWTARKLYFLCHYLEQTTRAMHGNAAFPAGLTYVDLFCGTGISCVEEKDGRLRRFPGSALIAASLADKPFSRLLLVDEDSNALEAAKSRALRAGFKGEIKTWSGDVNELIGEVTKALPAGALNVAFVDPYSLNVHFETIRALAAARPLDLIILFSDRIDLGRNVKTVYYPEPGSKLDLFLGQGSDWRKRYDALPDHSGPVLRQMFGDLYCEQLELLGYTQHKTWPLEGPQGPMFRLVFASKSALGLKFCEIALKVDFDGSEGLWGAM